MKSGAAFQAGGARPRENREPPVAARGRKVAGRRENAMSDKSLVPGSRESYRGMVPAKQPNKSETSLAEAVEGRLRTKDNTRETDPCRAPSRESRSGGPPSRLGRGCAALCHAGTFLVEARQSSVADCVVPGGSGANGERDWPGQAIGSEQR